MIKSYEVKSGEKTFLFVCEDSSTLGELHDVFHSLKEHTIKLMNEQNSQIKEEIEA